MTHVCFTPPQPVLHGDCTPNLSPPTPAGAGPCLSHRLGESAGTAGMGVAQPQRHQNRPLRWGAAPPAPRDTQQDAVSCASPRGRTATQNCSRAQPQMFTFLQLDLPAVRSPQPGREAEKCQGWGRRQPAGARRFQQGCLAAACINKPPGGRAAQKDENGAATGVI